MADTAGPKCTVGTPVDALGFQAPVLEPGRDPQRLEELIGEHSPALPEGLEFYLGGSQSPLRPVRIGPFDGGFLLEACGSERAGGGDMGMVVPVCPSRWGA